KPHYLLALVLLVVVLLAPAASAKAKDQKPDAAKLEAQAKGDFVDLESRVSRFDRNVEKLKENFAQEISERDKLMLQKRFVSGKEFYFMLEDYRHSAEIFWAIVQHPEARKFPKYNEAIYYLAESLFHLGYYFDAQKQFERLLNEGSTGTYFTLSLMRLIEISIAQGNYDAAEKHYAR
ncbi:MAG: hypothetical protein GY852_02125, partial [bacterium]|nr:hypothetical protein [bacterium]